MPTVKNPLFTIISNANTGDLPLRYVAKTSKENCPYFIIELPKQYNKLNIDDVIYHVEEQHISIFENLTNFSRNSLYHCTVTLKAPAGKIHKLRAYYDKNDVLIDGLSFKTSENAQTDDESSIQISRQTQKMLGDILLAQCSPAIRRIIHFKNQQREAIKTQYLTLVHELLKKIDSIKSKDFDLAKELIQELDNLQPQLTNVRKNVPGFRDSERLRLKTLLIYKMSEWKKTQSSVKTTSHSTPSISKETEIKRAPNFFLPNTTKPTELHTNHTRKKNLDKSSGDFTHDFQTFCTKYDALNINPQTLEGDVPQLIELHNELNQLKLRLEIDELKSARSHQERLQEMELFLSDLLSELLTKAMSNNKMHLIIELSQQATLLPETVLKYAIDKQHIKLIELFFKKNQFSINKISITTKNGSIVDVLTYAFMNNYHRIFGLLLELGANPLVVMTDGLPLLHKIIEQQDSPFLLSTIQHLRLKGHKSYFKQLCITLEDYLNSHEHPLEKVTELRETIQKYQHLQDYEPPVSSREAAASAEDELNIIRTFKISPELQAAIKTNPALTHALNKYQAVLYDNIKMLSKEEYRKLSRIGKLHFLPTENQPDEKLMKMINPEQFIVILNNLTSILPLHYKIINLSNSKKLKGQTNEAKLIRAQIKALHAELEARKKLMGLELLKSLVTSNIDSLSNILEQCFESHCNDFSHIELSSDDEDENENENENENEHHDKAYL